MHSSIGTKDRVDGLSSKPKERSIATTKQVGLQDLFTETLKDIYFAEKQILRALPKMTKEASSPELKQAFETHRDETEKQVERLNEIFESMGRPARGKTCDAIIGIIDEGKEIMDQFKGTDARDAGLAASAQSRRALWDRPLWFEDVGERARDVGSRKASGRDAAGGNQDRQAANSTRHIERLSASKGRAEWNS